MKKFKYAINTKFDTCPEYLALGRHCGKHVVKVPTKLMKGVVK